ncbi:hypothetical protein HPP92_002994 [Vanilla planifolia]|uniref:AT-hook motif nuclear-localized protein n=1 Tax=Vanilla planifolia TaxID=51239 RepID=A0A835S6K3_VANPL|nr:hypothetical protein HPP92_002994 [Vanilla planifolia]
MEVRPEPGILTGRESFTMGVQKSPTSSPAPVLHNMRMEFGGDGAAVYRPVSVAAAPESYQSVGGELAAAAQGLVVGTGEPVKRKRGRPRKYASDGSVIAPVLSSAVPAGSSAGFSLSYTSAAPLRQESSSLPVEQTKKARGRPLGSGKKHQLDALGFGGIGFTPHVIAVKAGEDVSSKIMSFFRITGLVRCAFFRQMELYRMLLFVKHRAPVALLLMRAGSRSCHFPARFCSPRAMVNAAEPVA